MLTVEGIRDEFRNLLPSKNGNLEIFDAQFLANEDRIFGEPNKEYIKAEIEWYDSMSRDVRDLFKIYGKKVQIWDDVACNDHQINSNYGWCIYSAENGNQYANVLDTLQSDPESRQATMIYINPEMHYDSKENGRKDFMCTTHVQYRLEYGAFLHASVYMRSNDAIFGYNNDYAWQRVVQKRLAKDLGVHVGDLIWNVSNLHIYPRHMDLVQ